MESLLPFTVKGTEEKLKKRLEMGLRVKGTGVGERVKGKIEERTLKSRYAFLVLCLVGRMAVRRCLVYLEGEKKEGALMLDGILYKG